MSGPISIKMSDHKELVGKFAVLFRNNVKVPAKILRIDVVEKRIIYELLGGIDKGKRMSSRYDETQMATVYDSDNLMLALMETS
jgi:hypothetical protein